MKKGILSIILFVFSLHLYAASVVSDSILKQRITILKLISNFQSNNPSDGLHGSFPSFRKYYFSSKLKQEDNVFFTSLVLLNIGQFRQKMYPEELLIFEKAKAKAIVYLERFKNQKNQLTYNFWPRNPPQIFPNGGWLNLFNKKFALADDIDDGAITLLALGANDSLAKAMQSKFGDYRVGLIKPNQGFFIKNLKIGQYIVHGLETKCLKMLICLYSLMFY